MQTKQFDEIREKAECDQNTFSKSFYENPELGSETESRAGFPETDSRLSDSRRSPTRKNGYLRDDLGASLIPKDEYRNDDFGDIENMVNSDKQRDSDKQKESLAISNINTISRQCTSESLVKSPIEINIEDATFSAAKFRWIQAVNKIRVKLRETNEPMTTEKALRKSNWGAQAIATNFLSSIDSMPNFKPRRKSIPLVSEISAALMLKEWIIFLFNLL